MHDPTATGVLDGYVQAGALLSASAERPQPLDRPYADQQKPGNVRIKEGSARDHRKIDDRLLMESQDADPIEQIGLSTAGGNEQFSLILVACQNPPR